MGTVFHNYHFLTHSHPALQEERISDENCKNSACVCFTILNQSTSLTFRDNNCGRLCFIHSKKHWLFWTLTPQLIYNVHPLAAHSRTRSQKCILKCGNLQIGFFLISIYIIITMAPLHFFARQFNLGLLLLVSEASSPRVNKAEL